MKRYLDFKTTVWKRIPIYSENEMKEIIKRLDNDHTVNDLCDDPDLEIQEKDIKTLTDTEELCYPNDNEYSTVQVFEKGELIWCNLILP